MPLPYGMRDPFADINARLRKLGLEPITMGGAPAKPDIAAMYQQPISTLSPVEEQQALVQQAKKAGPMYNQLTPEAEEGVMEKIGMSALSGLEWFGKALDSVTGARALRGVLGGNFREALSFAGPLAPWTDTLGITDPKDIVGGRELLEKGGILGKNKEGLDWGDVAGFGAEVLLDPSTYFFGAGLMTKGVGAGTKVAKALNKIGVLDDVLRKGTTDDKLLRGLLSVKKDKVSIKALEDIASGAAKKGGGTGIRMGQRQLGRRLDIHDILRVDDEITEALGRSGKESLDEIETLARSFRGIDNRPVREVLEESVGGPEELARLIKEEWVLPSGEAMPLTSHWSMGFPTLFTGGGKEGTKGIRQALFSNLPDVMTRKQYFPSLDKGFGKNIDAFAGRLDVAGDIIRFGKYTPIRGAATLFNPKLKWNARTEIAQRAILNDISKGERHIKQANTALYGIESELRLNRFLDKEHYMETMGLSEEAAEKRIAEQAHDFYSALEGFGVKRIVDPSDPEKILVIPQLPTHDINKAPKIRRTAEVNFYTAKTRYNSVTKQLNDTVDLQKREPARLREIGATEEVVESTMRQLEIDRELLVRAQREAEEMGAEWQKVMDDLDVLLDVEGGGKSPTYSDYQTAGAPVGTASSAPIEYAQRFGLDNADEIIVRMKNLKKKFNQAPPEGLPRPDDIKGYVQDIDVYDIGGKRKKIGKVFFDAPKGGVHDRSFPKLSESLSKLPGKLGITDPEGVTHLEKLLVRLTYYGQEALDRAAAAGMDTSELSDTWTLFHPRSAEEPVQKGLMGYIEKARNAKNLKARMHAAESSAMQGTARKQTENLNPVSRRMSRRRKYLQNIFGGTNTLNYFYSKFGGERLKRVVGEHILTEPAKNKVIDSIVNDDYWHHTLQNAEYRDHLLDEGFLIKINLDPKKQPKLPVDSTGTEQLIIATKFDDVSKEGIEGVYVNRNNNAVEGLAESILDKDPSLGEGVKLFSTDPIRSMVGYYGDVIKASVAADIVLEVGSKNAYFNLLKHLEVATGDGNPHSVAKILSDTKLDTVIGKRKFIDRLRSERPEQWQHFLDVWTKPLDELKIEHPELVETMRQARKDYPEAHDFIKKLRDEPEKIGIEVHDEVRSALPGDGETYTVQAKNFYRNGELVDTEDLTKPRDGGPTEGLPEVDSDGLERSVGEKLSPDKPEQTPEYQIADDPFDEAESVLGPKADGSGYTQEEINWYQSSKRKLIEEGEEDTDTWLREMYKDRQSAPAAEAAPQVQPVVEAAKHTGMTPESVQDMRGVIDKIRNTGISPDDAADEIQVFYDTGVFIADHSSDVQRKNWLKKEMFNLGLDRKRQLKINWREIYAAHLEKRLKIKLGKLKEPLSEVPAPTAVDDVVTSYVQLGKSLYDSDSAVEVASKEVAKKTQGTLSFTIGTVGDIMGSTYKMFDGVINTGSMYGLDRVKSQVDSAIDSLTSSHGFAKEVAENLASNASARNIPIEQLEAESAEALSKYAQAYKALPVKNHAQKIMQRATVALAEGNYDKALKNLRIIKKYSESNDRWIKWISGGVDERTWNKVAAIAEEEVIQAGKKPRFADPLIPRGEMTRAQMALDDVERLGRTHPDGTTAQVKIVSSVKNALIEELERQKLIHLKTHDAVNPQVDDVIERIRSTKKGYNFPPFTMTEIKSLWYVIRQIKESGKKYRHRTVMPNLTKLEEDTGNLILAWKEGGFNDDIGRLSKHGKRLKVNPDIKVDPDAFSVKGGERRSYMEQMADEYIEGTERFLPEELLPEPKAAKAQPSDLSAKGWAHGQGSRAAVKRPPYETPQAVAEMGFSKDAYGFADDMTQHSIEVRRWYGRPAIATHWSPELRGYDVLSIHPDFKDQGIAEAWLRAEMGGKGVTIVTPDDDLLGVMRSVGDVNLIDEANQTYRLTPKTEVEVPALGTQAVDDQIKNVLDSAPELLEKASTIPGFGKLDIKDIPTSPAPTRDLSIIKGREIETVLPEPPAGRQATPTQSTEPFRAGFVDDAVPAGRAPVDGDKNGWYLVLDGLDGDHPIERYAQKHYIPNSVLRSTKDIGPGEAKEYISDILLKNFEIEGELSDDLKRYLNAFQKRDATHALVAGLDWFTDVFKDMATSLWPAFHFRNFASGQANNMFSGAYDPRYRGPRRWTQPVMDAMSMAEGKTIVGLIELDVFKAMKGIDTDQQATQYLVDLAVGHGLIGPGQHLSDLQQVATGQVHNFLERVGGPNPIIREDAAGGYLGGMAGRVTGARKLGDEVVGEVLGKAVPGYTKTARFGTGFKRMGFQLGNEVEFLNRMSPLIAHVRKGLSPEEAILKVKLAQVDYRALTPFEKQWMRRIIPFYTFTRRQIPFVVENMIDPSSGMSTTAKTMFRTKHAMDDPNEPVPDYISTNVNFPLHKLPGRMGTKEGQSRYLTGLGGMIGGLEDVSNLLKPGKGVMDTAKRTMSGLFARSNPIGQYPIETATGVSLFHQRPYKDMKSPTARLIGEASGSEFVPRFPTPEWDALFHKMPGYGRTVSTARTLMDRTRKPILDEGGNFSVGNLLARTVPTVMGARVTEVSMDRIKNRLLQNRLEEILSANPSMVKFSQIYIPEENLGALSQEELEAYMLYKKLGAAASKASYARKKAAEYSN